MVATGREIHQHAQGSGDACCLLGKEFVRPLLYHEYDTYKSETHLEQHQAPAEETQHELDNNHVAKAVVHLQGEAAREREGKE